MHNWVNQTYGVPVKYHLLRHYLINHFKTKLKSPRKSDYKKDIDSEQAILKTPYHINAKERCTDEINLYFQDEVIPISISKVVIFLYI